MFAAFNESKDYLSGQYVALPKEIEEAWNQLAAQQQIINHYQQSLASTQGGAIEVDVGASTTPNPVNSTANAMPETSSISNSVNGTPEVEVLHAAPKFLFLQLYDCSKTFNGR